MDKLYKILLIKAFIPFKRPLEENGEKHWLAEMLDTLETKYHLLPKYIRRLWYLQRRIATGNLNTDYIYTYDWVMSREQYIPVGI